MNLLPNFQNYRRVILILVGISISLLAYYWNPFNLDYKGNIVVSIAILMIFWWVSEVMPMAVVALIPIVLFPILKISSIEETCKHYTNNIIFLFMGGFFLGLAIEKWNLHKRIALNIINITGTSGNRIILGFILSTGFISMWISNTATTMMMFPIALSVITVVGQHEQDSKKLKAFSIAIMLSIAYASNFGGLATIIGTPPNVAYVTYFDTTYHTSLDFFYWAKICAPISIFLLIALYFVLVKVLFPNHIKANNANHDFIKHQISALGKMDKAQMRVTLIFIITALLWIFRSTLNNFQSYVKLDDTIIAVICAISLFMIGSGYKYSDEKDETLLTWQDTSKMAWGILLLFGGGLSLAAALEQAGLIKELGLWLSSFSHHKVMMIISVTVLSIFISEVMSNIAQVIVFAPVVTSIAEAINVNPLALGVPMTLAASCASMLPMGTPPNAIVFASGKINSWDMIKAGFVMNMIAIILIVLMTYSLWM